MHVVAALVSPALLLLGLIASTLAGGPRMAQETPALPTAVYETLVEDFYMDGAIGLLGVPRSRVEMHEYLTAEGDFFFLITQPAGDVTIDDFRPSGDGAIQSLTLTMTSETEALSMVHLLIRPEFSGQAASLAAGALDSADQGGERQTRLYLLGIHESDTGPRRVILREETSSAGDSMYWIHYQ